MAKPFCHSAQNSDSVRCGRRVSLIERRGRVSKPVPLIISGGGIRPFVRRILERADQLA